MNSAYWSEMNLRRAKTLVPRSVFWWLRLKCYTLFKRHLDTTYFLPSPWYRNDRAKVQGYHWCQSSHIYRKGDAQEIVSLSHSNQPVGKTNETNVGTQRITKPTRKMVSFGACNHLKICMLWMCLTNHPQIIILTNDYSYTMNYNIYQYFDHEWLNNRQWVMAKPTTKRLIQRSDELEDSSHVNVM